MDKTVILFLSIGDVWPVNVVIKISTSGFNSENDAFFVVSLDELWVLIQYWSSSATIYLQKLSEEDDISQTELYSCETHQNHFPSIQIQSTARSIPSSFWVDEQC